MEGKGSGAEQAKALKRKAVGRGEYIKEHQSKTIFNISLQVVIFFMLQSAAYNTFNIFPCVKIDIGTAKVSAERNFETFLSAEPSISCESATYLRLRLAAKFCAFLYGFFFPVGIFAYIGWNRHRYFEDYYRLYTAFWTMGIREGAWYWQGVMVLRRIFVIVMLVFLEKPIDAYVVMWGLAGFAAFQYVIRPYTSERLNSMDSFGLMSILITANVGLVFNSIDSDSDWRNALMYILIVVQSLTYVIFFVELIRTWLITQVERARERRKHDSDDDVEDVVHSGDASPGQHGESIEMRTNKKSNTDTTSVAVSDGDVPALPLRSEQSAVQPVDPAADRVLKQLLRRPSVSKFPAVLRVPVFDDVDDPTAFPRDGAPAPVPSQDSSPRPMKMTTYIPKGAPQQQKVQRAPATNFLEALERDIDDFFAHDAAYQTRPPGLNTVAPEPPQRPPEVDALLAKLLEDESAQPSVFPPVPPMMNTTQQPPPLPPIMMSWQQQPCVPPQQATGGPPPQPRYGDDGTPSRRQSMARPMVFPPRAVPPSEPSPTREQAQPSSSFGLADL